MLDVRCIGEQRFPHPQAFYFVPGNEVCEQPLMPPQKGKIVLGGLKSLVIHGRLLGSLPCSDLVGLFLQPVSRAPIGNRKG